MPNFDFLMEQEQEQDPSAKASLRLGEKVFLGEALEEQRRASEEQRRASEKERAARHLGRVLMGYQEAQASKAYEFEKKHNERVQREQEAEGQSKAYEFEKERRASEKERDEANLLARYRDVKRRLKSYEPEVDDEVWAQEAKPDLLTRYHAAVVRLKAYQSQEAARTPTPRLETTFRSAGVESKVLSLLRAMFSGAQNLGMGPDTAEVDFPNFYVWLATEYPGGRKVLEELASVYAQERPEPPAVQAGRAQGQVKPGELPEMDYLADLRQERGRWERLYFDALRRTNTYPELKTFWGAALFFLTSLLLGPKNAAMIFMRKHDDGTLKEELRYYRDRVRGAEQQEQYAVRAAERARTEEGRRRQREVQQATALRFRAFGVYQQAQRLDEEKKRYKERMDRLEELDEARFLKEGRAQQAAAQKSADTLLGRRINIAIATLKVGQLGGASKEDVDKAFTFLRFADKHLAAREEEAAEKRKGGEK